jgi:Ca-activated chloride channel family protein
VSINFLWPWLFLLLPIPFLYRKFRHPSESKAPYLQSNILFELAKNQDDSLSLRSRNKFLFFLLAATWICLITAIARPVKIGEPIALPPTGRDILMAVDISGSMEREDMIINGRQVNRLFAVKSVVGDFVSRAIGSPIFTGLAIAVMRQIQVAANKKNKNLFLERKLNESS